MHRNPSHIVLALFAFALLTTVPTFGQGQGVGIDTETPGTKLDINGDFAMRVSALSLSGEIHNDISIGSSSFVEITGPVANYEISGIADGTDGKLLILFNNTDENMKLMHENVLSAASNRIILSNEADDDIKKRGCATLIYSGISSRWVVVSLYKE